MIILPNRNLIVPNPKPLFEAHSKFAGRYKLTVRNSEGHITRETPWFDNLITNNGLDLIWTSPAVVFGVKVLNPNCHVGTGSATPAFTDTTLQAWLATGGQTSVSSTTYVAGPPPYWMQTATYRFGTGVAAGNLSEVGVGVLSNNLFSRSLIKDSFGNPTTITVLSDEVLDVTYELRVYPPTTDSIFNVLLNGVSRSVTGRSYAIQSPPNIYAAIPEENANTALPYPIPTISSSAQPGIDGTGGVWTEYGGAGAARDGVTNPSYIIGSYEINCAAYWGLTKANGQNQLWFLSWPHGQMTFNIAVPATKASTQQMSMNYKISWARYP